MKLWDYNGIPMGFLPTTGGYQLVEISSQSIQDTWRFRGHGGLSFYVCILYV